MSTKTAPDWDPRDPTVLRDQRDAYDSMREQCPVAHSDFLSWSLFRHGDLATVLADPKTYSSASHHRAVPNGMDPPEHTIYRRVLEPCFTPEWMTAFEPDCRKIAIDLVHSLLIGDVDFVREFAHPYTLKTHCAFLGWPLNDWERLHGWTHGNQDAGLARDKAAGAALAHEFAGFVERLFVNSTGQQVRRGQPMLTIYSPELVAAQQELLLAAKLDRSIGTSSVPGVPGEPANLTDASRRRLQLWDISNAQINDILRTGQVRRTLTLYAPVSGIVVDKKVLQGQAITSGQELYTIADLSDVWVDAELREADAANVRVGSVVGIQFAGLPARPYSGRVAFVYPTLQQEARSVKARIVIPNADGVLKPGMYGTVQLKTPSRSALAVPSSAILRTGDRNIVFIDIGNGQLKPHDVEPGSTAGDYTEILSGLEPGQRVVTSAQFLLDSESNLGEVMKSMIGNKSSGDKSSASTADMKMGTDTAPPAPKPPPKPAVRSVPKPQG